jgi:hypothetical protein
MKRYAVAVGVMSVLLVTGWTLDARSSRQIRAPYGGEGTVHGARPASDCRTADPPCPPSKDWVELAEGFDFTDQLTFAPPAGSSPLIDAKEAEDIAWLEDATTPDAKEQQAQLAMLPAGGNFSEDTLVWLVRYTGACLSPSIIANWPKDRPKPKCTNSTWTTVIDANTGDFIYGFTDG